MGTIVVLNLQKHEKVSARREKRKDHTTMPMLLHGGLLAAASSPKSLYTYKYVTLTTSTPPATIKRCVRCQVAEND